MSIRDGERRSIAFGALEGIRTYMHIIKALADTIEDDKTRDAILLMASFAGDDVNDAEGCFEKLLQMKGSIEHQNQKRTGAC